MPPQYKHKTTGEIVTLNFWCPSYALLLKSDGKFMSTDPGLRNWKKVS